MEQYGQRYADIEVKGKHKDTDMQFDYYCQHQSLTNSRALGNLQSLCELL